MAQKITPIKTELGFIHGRDAIYLQQVHFVSETEICISGEIQTNNCSDSELDTELAFNITFKGVLRFQTVELDFDETEYESCFDLIENSEKLAQMRARDAAAKIGKVDRGYDKNGKFSDEIYHQHYVLRTYDSVFELVAQSYALSFKRC